MNTDRKKSPSPKALLMGTALLAIPILFLLFFFFLPLRSIFESAFLFFGTEISLKWANVWKVLRFTFFQAFVSMALTLLFGFPVAWVFSRFKFPLKGLLRGIISVPFILPTVVTAAAFNALLGPRGWINMLWTNITGNAEPLIQMMNTFGIIILAHVFYNISVVVRIVGNSWIQIDSRYESAAKTLGASSWTTFWEVTFPQLKPAIFSAMLLVFLFDFSSYGVITLLGGPRFRTIEVEIYHQALQMLNLPGAGFLSLVQILITLVITAVDRKLSNTVRSNQMPRVANENIRKPARFSEKALIFMILTAMLIFVLAPLLGLVARSVYAFPSEVGRTAVESGWTLSYYRQLFINERGSVFYVPPIAAIGNSLVTAMLAAIISIIVALLLVLAVNRYPRTGIIETVFILPIGTSSVTLGLGYLLFFRSEIRSFWLIPFAHSLIALPFVIRSLKPAIMNIPDSLRQSAAVMGASPIRVFFEIDLPILFRGMVTGCIFAFTISLGEFGATSFITRPDRPTIPIAIYRYLGQVGLLNYGQAMAMSTILMAFCLVMVVVVDRQDSDRQHIF